MTQNWDHLNLHESLGIVPFDDKSQGLKSQDTASHLLRQGHLVKSTTVTSPETYATKQTGNGGTSGRVQTPVNPHLGQDKPKVFDAAGAIGHQFTEDGAIGKQFTMEGGIDDTVQDKLGGTTSKSN
ncbi:hypothetical protein J7T55_002766 [Diaporthe amygdali]|uniref:uncharacterized protein n=1 Tax=Phomopsis amygdali TaxID=1214568 RepID=UPI0022FDC48C|nr:uncharacterized protein J7T55_002766 [Diaporthe amygdali]KAJ0122254.1 hypothetical protein J7T55_002766 [Diaporthe amygdali]